MNLAEGLASEIKRNQELLKMYEGIPTGFIGASMLKLDINRAIDVQASGDVVEMLVVFEKLKNNE